MNIFILEHDSKNSSYSGKSYVFLSSTKEKISWPIESGAYLGPVGAWNALTRAGYTPSFCKIDCLPAPHVGDLLIIHAVGHFSPEAQEKLLKWLSAGAKIIACGDIDSYSAFLTNCVLTTSYSELPYAGLGYLNDDGHVDILAPAKWSFSLVKAKTDAANIMLGPELICISGARNIPSIAIKKPINNAPSWAKKGGFTYLNGNPFSAFQAWLQGQEDLNPWLNWRDELNWLDVHVAFHVNELLNTGEGLLKNAMRRQTYGSPVKIVFRHDVDSSTETCLLEETNKRGFSSTYAVLLDRNRRFWNEQTHRSELSDNAFHYSTTDDSLLTKIKQKLGFSNSFSIKTAKKNIAYGGLRKQLNKAKSSGIGTETIHRHFSHIYYPEYVEAFFSLEKEFPDFLGGSSYFRGSILRWGSLRVDGDRSTIRPWPDPWFSYWYPFKLCNAAKFGEPSLGYESCSAMELEPEHAFQLLQPPKHELLEKIVTLIYHPAHALQATFCKDGTIGWLKEICDHIGSHDIEVISLSNLYKQLRKSQK